MSKFLYNAENNNDANAVAIPLVFSENNRAKNEIIHTSTGPKSSCFKLSNSCRSEGSAGSSFLLLFFGVGSDKTSAGVIVWLCVVDIPETE